MLPPNPNKNLTFDENNLREIYLAGGCFWGVDAYMARVPGVYSTESGYANGHESGKVTYEEVCTGKTGHTEAIYLKYDPTKVNLDKILDEFFSIIDPTTLNRQANDIGTQYRTGIYITEKNTEEDIDFINNKFKEVQAKYQKPLAIEIRELSNYCKAEDYHQDYLEKNPGGYCHISFN